MGNFQPKTTGFVYSLCVKHISTSGKYLLEYQEKLAKRKQVAENLQKGSNLTF